jgi:hypothetical protein
VKVGGQFSGRTAFLVFALLFIFLRVLFPYSMFNSDVATYGYMGNDIIKYGYLPTIPYGQNYLFPITPYLYALYRIIAPSSVSDVVVLTAAGGTLSLAGYWMVYESLLLAMKMAGKDAVAPGAMFVAFLALSPHYHMDMMENSGLEISIFTLGAMAFTATLIQARIRRLGAAGFVSPFVFGMTWVYSIYARPQMAAYGIAFFIALAAAAWKAGKWRGALRLAIFTAVGGVAGYIPMALHKIYRAPNWPFALKSDLHMGTAYEIQDRLLVFAYRIFRDIMNLSWDWPYFSAGVIALAVASVAVFAVASIRNREETSVAGVGLFWGSLIIIVAMAILPGLSWNPGMRRYCLQVFVAFAFIFASAIPFRHIAVRAVMGMAVAVTLILSTSVWSDRLADEKIINEWFRDAKAMIPVLAAQKKVIMAEYWDAYMLGFMAEGKVEIEAFPWDLVRRYGAIPEKTMRQGSAWLIREGFGGTVYGMIGKDMGMPKAKIEVSIPLFGKRHVYTEFRDPSISAELMKKARPEYFTVKYPPGS